MAGSLVPKLKPVLDIESLQLRLDDSFRYWYQPQFALRCGSLKGFECLLRLDHPTLGVIAPGQFPSIIQSEDIWRELWPIMLSKVANTQLFSGCPILSINVSPKDLELGEDSALLQSFYDKVRSWSINPSKIEFEITEEIKISDFKQVNLSIDFLRELGASVVIDDFGAGFCNMSSLEKLNVSGIKIDKGLIVGLGASKIKQAIVKSIVDIAKVKGCYTLAEGIETKEQLNHVTVLGCDFAQGYFLGHPSPSF